MSVSASSGVPASAASSQALLASAATLDVLGLSR